MVKHWLIVERYENWLVDMGEGFKRLGFSDRHRRRIKEMKKGDNLVIYVTRKSGFAGIYEIVSSTYYRDTELIWDDIFPIRIEIKPKIMLQESNFVPAKRMVNELSFTRGNIEKWGKYFQNSIRELREEDYRTLSRVIHEARKAQET